MTKIILPVTLFLANLSALASTPKNLDDLLKKVKEERIEGHKKLSEREQRFTRERNRQRQLLAEEAKKLKALEKISDRLQGSFEKK